MEKKEVKTKSTLGSLATIMQLVDKYLGSAIKVGKRIVGWIKTRRNESAKEQQKMAYDKAKKAVEDKNVKIINDILQK